MREQRIAEIAEDWTFDDAGHVRALGHFGCGDVDLEAVAVGVFDGGAVNDAIEFGPKGVGHAHRAWLAGGVHGVAGQRWFLEFFASEADGSYFGVGTGIVFAHDGVDRAHQQLAGFGVDDERAEWGWTRGGERARGEGVDLAHAVFVERGHTRTHFCRGAGMAQSNTMENAGHKRKIESVKSKWPHVAWAGGG